MLFIAEKKQLFLVISYRKNPKVRPNLKESKFTLVPSIIHCYSSNVEACVTLDTLKHSPSYYILKAQVAQFKNGFFIYLVIFAFDTFHANLAMSIFIKNSLTQTCFANYGHVLQCIVNNILLYYKLIRKSKCMNGKEIPVLSPFINLLSTDF